MKMRNTLVKIISSKRECEVLASVYEGIFTLDYNENYDQLLSQVRLNLRLIDFLISILDDDESFVIEKRLIDRMSWFEVLREYETSQQHARPKSIRSLQRLLLSALDNMEQLVRQTPVLWQTFIKVS